MVWSKLILLFLKDRKIYFHINVLDVDYLPNKQLMTEIDEEFQLDSSLGEITKKIGKSEYRPSLKVTVDVACRTGWIGKNCDCISVKGNYKCNKNY